MARLVAAPGLIGLTDVRALQRSAGNQAVAPLLQRASPSDSLTRPFVQREDDLEKLRDIATRERTHEGVEKTDSVKEAISIGGDVGKVGKGSTTLAENITKDMSKTDSVDPAAGLAGGIAGTVASFFAVAKAVKQLKAAKSGVDEFGAMLELSSGLYTGTAAGAKIVAKSTELAQGKETTGAKVTGGVAGGLGAFAAALNGVKETFLTIKGIVELARDAHKLSSEEKFHQAMEVVKHALEGAKSGVEAVKTFLDTFGSGASTAITKTLPSLGIAVGAADLTIRGYDLVVASIRWGDMRKKKRKLKRALLGQKGKSLKDYAKWLVEESTASPKMKARAQEYLLSRGLQYVNAKRVRRAILKISVAMANIAGDIATLSVAAAAPGAAIKVGAIALDVGAGFFRRFKQWARDRTAKKEAKKPGSKWAKIFSTSKSTQAKNKLYNDQVDVVLDMIWKATEDYKAAQAMPEEPAEDRQAAVKAAVVALKRSRDYVEAMGLSVDQLHREAEDPVKMKQKMIAALKKRE